MKNIFTLLCLTIVTTLFAQAPQGFNYQATVRNGNGDLIVNQNVFFKFNIMQTTATGLPIYSETHYLPTDDLGQINLVIGQGTSTLGNFSQINWGSGIYFLGIELNSGSGYIAMGTTQLLSVPYAMYANNSGNSTVQIPSLADVLAINNSANNLKITDLLDPTDPQDLVTKGYLDSQLQNQVANLQNQINVLQGIALPPLPAQPYVPLNWSSTNLDVETYRDGTVIPQVMDPVQWANLTTGAWCYYANLTENGIIYGKLYNGYAMQGIHNEESKTNQLLRKELAPLGYHIPTSAELQAYLVYLGGANVAGGKMKEAGTAHWTTPNTGATNTSGFTGLPGGFRDTNGAFLAINFGANFWLYREDLPNLGPGFNLNYGNSTVDVGGSTGLKRGYSVRCVQN